MYRHNIVLLSCVLSLTAPFALLQAESTVFKIITYNIRREGGEKKLEQQWSHRKNRVAQQLIEQNAEIICLQEATINQIAYLKEQLLGFDVIGTGRGASWFGKGADEHNPIFYNRTKYMLLKSETFFINKQKSMIWNPFTYKKTGLLPRICTMATFKCMCTGNIFSVFNTHLDNNFNAARRFGAKNIAKYIQDNGLEEEPIIITGDFNTGFITELHAIFSTFQHAREIATEASGPKETRTGWNDEELKQIDHILVQKKGLKVLSYTIVQEQKPYASDHRLSYAVIELGPV